MKLIFLHADKHQTIPQVNTINFGGYGHTCPNYPKQQVCEIFAILQGRSEEGGLSDFGKLSNGGGVGKIKILGGTGSRGGGVAFPELLFLTT